MRVLTKIGLVLLLIGLAMGTGSLLYLGNTIMSSTTAVTVQPHGTYTVQIPQNEALGVSYNITTPIVYKVSGQAVVNSTEDPARGLKTVIVVPQGPNVTLTLENPGSTNATVLISLFTYSLIGITLIVILGFIVFIVGVVLTVIGFVKGRKRT
ncbi:MAG: hypothetical protein ACP5HQ_03815 [Thermoprotei archaeon]